MTKEELLAMADRVQKVGNDIEKTWGAHPNSQAAYEAVAYIRSQAAALDQSNTDEAGSSETPTPKKTTRRTKKAAE